MIRRLPSSYMIRAAPGTRFIGVEGLNVTDRSAIDAAKSQTLPRKVISGAVEIIMHFKSTASFTHHGSTPFVDCEMTCLVIESHVYLRPWNKHEHCHANASHEVVDNSASFASCLNLRPYRHMGQPVPLPRRCVANHPDRHIDDAVRIVYGMSATNT
jgi:hypothetical protein